MSERIVNRNKLIQCFDSKLTKKVISKLDLSTNSTPCIFEKNVQQTEKITVLSDYPSPITKPIDMICDHSEYCMLGHSTDIKRTINCDPTEHESSTSQINSDIEIKNCQFSPNNSNLIGPSLIDSNKTSKKPLENEIELFDKLSDSHKAKYFKSLGNTKKKCIDTIKMIDEIEFSMDDLNDSKSLWIQEPRYLKKINQIYRLEHKLKHQKIKRRRKLFKLNDESISKFLRKDVEHYVNNCLKAKIFNNIDYDEILEVIKNSYKSLNIPFGENQLEALANIISLEIYHGLQRQRINSALTYIDNCVDDNSNILNSQDPANTHPKLLSKLTNHDEFHQIKMEVIV